MSKVVPWSYTSLTSFETCPRRFYLTRVTKEVKEPQSQAMLHGNEVHKALEVSLRDGQPLPEKYSQHQPIIDRLSSKPGTKLIEHKVALTKGFKETSFFSKDCWVRGVVDVGIVQGKSAVVLDYKTGKPKSDPSQLKLFAGMTLSSFPKVEKVTVGFMWLAHNRMNSDDKAIYTRDDLPVIWEEFSSRVSRMESAERENRFVPKPSGLCREWCPVGKKLCEFCGK